MSEQHTPGPWRLCPVHPPESPESWDVVGATDWCVAERIEKEADARLIGAAPELLYALKRLVNDSMFKDHPEASQMAIDAVAKAEGRQ